MSRATIKGVEVWKRPGVKCLHRFRSNVVAMTVFRERIIVLLDSGKAYRSNAKLTRWYKISAEPFFT